MGRADANIDVNPPGAVSVSCSVVPTPPSCGSCHLTGLEERYYFLLDDQHSTVALTNETGDIVEGYEYTPYGEVVVYAPGPDDRMDWNQNDTISSKSFIGNEVLFQGRRLSDETGLYYFRTRYYDPDMGRFISSDTIGVWGDAANLGNGYAFLANAPHFGMDPEGESGTADPNCPHCSPSKPYIGDWIAEEATKRCERTGTFEDCVPKFSGTNRFTVRMEDLVLGPRATNAAYCAVDLVGVVAGALAAAKGGGTGAWGGLIASAAAALDHCPEMHSKNPEYPALEIGPQTRKD